MSTTEVSYRWVNGPECSDTDWDRIEGILAARGWMSLNRPTSCILIAEEPAGDLCGFIVFQLIPHAEPLWVKPSMRSSGLAEDLADKMLDFLASIKVRGFMVVAESTFAAELCKQRGMTKVESPVYVSK